MDPTGIYNVPWAKLTLNRGPDVRAQSLLLQPINIQVGFCNQTIQLQVGSTQGLQAADTALRSWALLALSRNKRLGMTVSLIANTCWSISILVLAPVRDYITHPSIPCCVGYPQNGAIDGLCTSFINKTLFFSSVCILQWSGFIVFVF